MLMVLFTLVYSTSSKQNDEMTTALWPSFKNSSYVYILGLFFKQQSSLLTTPEERAMFMSAILLSQRKNITLNGKQFAYRLEETNALDAMDVLDHTCLSISENQILGIVGPPSSNEAKTIARFCNRAGLPVFGYSTTDPELSDRNAYETFYRMSASDIIMAQALLKLFQKYHWTSTNIIYQGDSYGQGGLEALIETFGSHVDISRKIKYDIFTNGIEDFRNQLVKSPSRIVLLWASVNITTNIIQLALAERDILAPDFLWIMTATNSRMHLNDPQLAGMLLIRPVSPQAFDVPINRLLLKDAIDIWKTYDPESYNGDEKYIDAFALYAFDSAWMLILAFNELCQQKPSDCPSLLNTSHCFASYLTNRNKIHKILQTMLFFGVSGHVQFDKNTTDRRVRDGLHFIIDNLQPLNLETYELQAVEVLKHSSNTKDAKRQYYAQWIETGPVIQWPRGVDKIPFDYASIKGELKIVES
jgi:ABC-type branched-subunit amino acid transport system substrate-binding protein